MKTRESGMPEESYWETFFDPECIAKRMGADASCGNVVEFGCGYGTFTVPVAAAVSGTVYALDIDPEMIVATEARTRNVNLANVRVIRRDLMADGPGLPDATCDLALLLNMLHCEEPVTHLREAYRNLRPGGRVAIIHWIHDPATPRGPSLAVRPKPEQCRAWAEEVGFVWERDENLTCCAYHWGLVLRRLE
ncbi:MAG: class I SAM-dependent methyltransferase [Fibrella sp.]|nr:class I SAM-dependent methyltransferase [Armatimonadota bacterium]